MVKAIRYKPLRLGFMGILVDLAGSSTFELEMAEAEEMAVSSLFCNRNE